MGALLFVYLMYINVKERVDPCLVVGKENHMKGRILVISMVIATIFVAEFALRTDAASVGSLISPSATPRKRPKARTETVNNNETITISGRKPKTNNAAHRTTPNVPTTTLTPKKVKPFIGGTDDGQSIRPASAASNTAAKQSTPASVNRRRPRNQDIEVENDETHWVGHDRTRRVRTTNNSTANRSTPKKTNRRVAPKRK